MYNGSSDIMIATGHAERTAITRYPPVKRVLQNRSLSRRYEVDEIDANIITDIYKSTIEGEADQETIKRHSEKDAENRFEDLFAERWIRHVPIGNTTADNHTLLCHVDIHMIQSRYTNRTDRHHHFQSIAPQRFHKVSRGPESAKTVPFRRSETHTHTYAF